VLRAVELVVEEGHEATLEVTNGRRLGAPASHA
jgi:hypothetical protein